MGRDWFSLMDFSKFLRNLIILRTVHCSLVWQVLNQQWPFHIPKNGSHDLPGGFFRFWTGCFCFPLPPPLFWCSPNLGMMKVNPSLISSDHMRKKFGVSLESFYTQVETLDSLLLLGRRPTIPHSNGSNSTETKVMVEDIFNRPSRNPHFIPYLSHFGSSMPLHEMCLYSLLFFGWRRRWDDLSSRLNCPPLIRWHHLAT